MCCLSKFLNAISSDNDEYLVIDDNFEGEIMSKIVDYNEICNKLFVDYEGIIDRFLLIRLRSKIFDIAMCIVNDSYIGGELREWYYKRNKKRA